MPVDRFSVTMDPELGKAVRDAAEAEGMTVSAWVAEAAAHSVRLKLLGEFLDDWEAEHGEFSEEEMADARKAMDPERRRRRKAARARTQDPAA
jgi:hypothetical protein